ncbi:hypothetical protein F5Y01DRAFT_329898 [Xylaria sp. FL0043]|nr:hypothetical protein F5Y01DRAFT_329898 [Xylaria sp. FL0043]
MEETRRNLHPSLPPSRVSPLRLRGRPKRAFTTVQSFWASAKRHPEMSTCLTPLNSRADILREVRQFEDGALPREGRARRRARLQNNKSTGDGTTYGAKLVIVAAGVAAGNPVSDLGTQLVAKSWSVAHVKLTDREAAVLRGIPTTCSRSCRLHVQARGRDESTQTLPDGQRAHKHRFGRGLAPPQTLEQSEFIPAEDEARCRTLLAQTFPWLTNRPLINKTLCWFADTADSGHGFKMFPIVGKWVKELLDAQDCKQSVARWQWKSRIEGGNWGDKVS